MMAFGSCVLPNSRFGRTDGGSLQTLRPHGWRGMHVGRISIQTKTNEANQPHVRQSPIASLQQHLSQRFPCVLPTFHNVPQKVLGCALRSGPTTIILRCEVEDTINLALRRLKYPVIADGSGLVSRCVCEKQTEICCVHWASWVFALNGCSKTFNIRELPRNSIRTRGTLHTESVPCYHINIIFRRRLATLWTATKKV